jgi:hypothetical protein
MLPTPALLSPLKKVMTRRRPLPLRLTGPDEYWQVFDGDLYGQCQLFTICPYAHYLMRCVDQLDDCLYVLFRWPDMATLFDSSLELEGLPLLVQASFILAQAPIPIDAQLRFCKIEWSWRAHYYLPSSPFPHRTLFSGSRLWATCTPLPSCCCGREWAASFLIPYRWWLLLFPIQLYPRVSRGRPSFCHS